MVAESPEVDGWTVAGESYEEVRQLVTDGVKVRARQRCRRSRRRVRRDSLRGYRSRALRSGVSLNWGYFPGLASAVGMISPPCWAGCEQRILRIRRRILEAFRSDG